MAVALTYLNAPNIPQAFNSADNIAPQRMSVFFHKIYDKGQRIFDALPSDRVIFDGRD